MKNLSPAKEHRFVVTIGRYESHGKDSSGKHAILVKCKDLKRLCELKHNMISEKDDLMQSIFTIFNVQKIPRVFAKSLTQSSKKFSRPFTRSN